MPQQNRIHTPALVNNATAADAQGISPRHLLRLRQRQRWTWYRIAKRLVRWHRGSAAAAPESLTIPELARYLAISRASAYRICGPHENNAITRAITRGNRHHPSTIPLHAIKTYLQEGKQWPPKKTY